VIHCTEPGQYQAVSKWTGQKRTFTTFEEAETYAMRPKRSRAAEKADAAAGAAAASASTGTTESATA
jgi:hypothetical protein